MPTDAHILQQYLALAECSMSYQWNSHAVTDSRLAQQIMGQFSDWRVLTTANMWQTSQNSGRVSIVAVGISLEVAMLLKEYITWLSVYKVQVKIFPTGCTGY